MSYLDVVGVEYSEETYAKKTGEYPNLTAGTAEGLIGQSYEADQSAYLYRKSHEGGRVREQIIGGTVAWNQLVLQARESATVYNLTLTRSADGHSLSVSGTSNNAGNVTIYDTITPIKVVKDHIYLADIGTPSVTGALINFISSGIVGQSVIIRKAISSGRMSINLNIANGTQIEMTVTPQVFDLTAMFGSIIADYIYSLEQSSAGAGVAWLKQYIDLDTYHAYNAGSLESVQTEGREVVGFNQWDEEWELGTFDTDTGLPSATNTGIRCKNPIPVISGATYYVLGTGTFRVWWYDSDDSLISTETTTTSNRLFTAPTNACYLRFSPGTNYGTTYNHDICINISDPAKNGTYEPYEKHTYPVSNVELRGIPKLVDNQLTFDGDVYAADGTITRKYYKKTFTACNSVSRHSSGYYYTVFTLADHPANTAVNTAIASNGYANIGNVNPGQYYVTGNGNTLVVVFIDQTLTSKNAVDSYLASNPLEVVYKLVTPTTETADPYAPVQAVGNTERWIDSRAVPVPVGQNSKYYPDYAEKIDHLPSDFSTLIAPTEVAYTATRNYAVGDYFIVDNVLYCATAAISTGTAITPDSNCRAVTIMEIIKEILDAL